MKKVFSLLLLLSLLITIFPAQTASAATKLNKNKITLGVGDTYKLRLSTAGSDVTWTSSDKTVATVSKGKVEAVCGGTAVITATSGKKKYKCYVTVKDEKTDVIYTAYIFDDSSIDDYIKDYKNDNPDIIDVKAYDDEHIVVTMWESKRQAMIKEYENDLNEYIDELLNNEIYNGAFIKIDTDKLFQNITVYAIKEKYENCLAGVAMILSSSMVSDLAQSLYLVDPKKRKCNLTIIDEASGEVLYPE